MRRKHFVLVLVIAALLLVGVTAPVAAGKVRVGVAYDGPGLGDASFNDMTHTGVIAAEADFPVKVREMDLVPPNGKLLTNDEVIGALIDKRSDLVIAVGFLYAEAVAAHAVGHPEVDFVLLDSFVDASNVASILFAAHEGSFLVGAAAALTSQTGTIGFVGGVDMPVIHPFEAGFAAGVHYIDPDAQVMVEYISEPPDFSGFGDPEAAYAIATGMYQAGADVVYHAAGFSGYGLFQAAYDYSMANAHVWAIGVDADQYLAVPSHVQPYILTSMMKRLDVATYDMIAAEVNGGFTGGAHTYDLAANGVGYATSGGFIDGIVPMLETIEAGIIDGTIPVPTTP